MFKILAFIALLAMAIASRDPDISNLFDTFLKDILDSQQLADGSFQTTYFNIPHRSAPGLIEPFIFGTRANAAQIVVSNVMRLRPVNKETRRQQVFDGEDFDYSVLATAVSMDIKVNGLPGNLTTFVGNGEKGEYLLSGSLHNLVMNVTMQTENRVIPAREVVPTIVDMIVTGNGEERATVESLSAQIIGDLVTTLFFKAFRDFSNSSAGRALEQAVATALEK